MKWLKTLYCFVCRLNYTINEDSGNIAFSCNEIGILNIDLEFWFGLLNLKKRKAVKDEWRIIANSVALLQAGILQAQSLYLGIQA